MKKYTYEGKEVKEILKTVSDKLGYKEFLFTKLADKKNLFQKKEVIEVIWIDDLKLLITNNLNIIFNSLVTEYEVNISWSNEVFNIKVNSNNNAILIGKNGKMLNSIKLILSQILSVNTNMYIKVVLDIGEYNEKHIHNLEKLAYNLSKEVLATNIEVKLDSMNSYDRRIVHNALSNNKNLITKSEGDEPNRYIIIKPKRK